MKIEPGVLTLDNPGIKDITVKSVNNLKLYLQKNLHLLSILSNCPSYYDYFSPIYTVNSVTVPAVPMAIVIALIEKHCFYY